MKHSESEQITDLRRRVKKLWNRIDPLTVVLNDAKELKLNEGESVNEEIDLIEK